MCTVETPVASRAIPQVAALNRAPAKARSLLRGDLEAVCNRCHGDQVPSYKTGMKAKTRSPETLPLTADGIITCAACHFVHGEDNGLGDCVLLDNRRGKLCLTCHKMSELQPYTQVVKGCVRVT